MLSLRADNWLVDKGDDKAESKGLSDFGKVRGKDHIPPKTGQRDRRFSSTRCHTSDLRSHRDLTVHVSRTESGGTLEHSMLLRPG